MPLDEPAILAAQNSLRSVRIYLIPTISSWTRSAAGGLPVLPLLIGLSLALRANSLVFHPIGHDFETHLLADLLRRHVRPGLEILYSPAGRADKINVEREVGFVSIVLPERQHLDEAVHRKNL